MALLWLSEGKDRVRPIRVRTGLTDGQETEIQDADLKEGMQVVAGVVQPNAQAGSSPFQSNQQQQGRPGGGPPRLPGM
jgi:hypothetical protein